MGKDFDIAKAGGACAACGKEFLPGEEIVATLKEAPEAADEQFVREDFCPTCWDGRQGTDASVLFGVWRTVLPEPQQKKRTFVDDDVLAQFFERLEGAAGAAKEAFRFVLALILMRKRLLVYDRMETGADGREVWTMHFRGSDRPCLVANPRMDDDGIAEVSRQLAQIIPGAADGELEEAP